MNKWKLHSFAGTLLLVGSIHGVEALAEAGSAPMNFKGMLIEPACTVEAKAIEVDFDPIVDKYLYQYSRTSGTAFDIQLRDCKPGQLGGIVKVKFGGAPSTALPGLLAVNGVKGIAIGLETLGGEAIYFNNQFGKGMPLQKGDNTISLMAYIRGEPQAITSRTIERGSFSAVATFGLEYE